IIDTDNKREIKRETYLYSAEQRTEAHTKCEAAAFGTIVECGADSVLNLPLVPFKLLKALGNWRTVQSPFCALERSLLPAACYRESKKIINRYAPNIDNKIAIVGALISGLSLAHGIVHYSGASPERLALAAWFYHCAGDIHNRHMHSNAVTKQITQSL